MGDEFDHDSGRSSPLASLTLALAKEMVNKNDGTDFDNAIQYVVGAVSVLKQNYNEAELVNSLRMIQSCIKKENVDVLEYLERSEVYEHIFTILKHLPASLEIQQAGFTVLFQLCEHSPKFRTTISSSGIHSFLLEQLKEYNTDKEIQYYGINVLAHLLSIESFRDQILLDKQEEEIAHVICVAIQSFPEVQSIEIAASRAISYFLTDNDENADLRAYFIEHVCDSVIDALRKETETETQIRILNCLFGKEEQQKMTLVEKDVHFTLMELCKKYPTNKSLMSEAMGLLALLSTDDTVRTIMSTNSFVQNGLFGIMDFLRLSEKAQRAGLRMMEILMPSILENKSKADEVSHTVVKCIYIAMFTQIEYGSVQLFLPRPKTEQFKRSFTYSGATIWNSLPSHVAGCRTLSVLLENRPEAHKWIGENSEEKQYPVHNLCVGALFSFRKNVEIFVSVCEAIFWIAADNERLCTSLMLKNVHVAIIDGLRRHGQMSLAVETGCRALRGLCIFLHDHKKAVVEYDAFALLTQLQERYKNDVMVQIEVVSAIACLADVDVVRYQCFVEEIPQKVRECMYQFAEDTMIQEAGLETFAVLAGAEGGQEILLNDGALNVVLETMEGSPDNVLIIKKGLIVLQLLASPTVVQNKETRRTIVTILKSALQNFTDSKGVQSEACVALQLLAEVDKKMSRAFVDADCHECLFRNLENDSATGIHELSSECLFVLSQEQNLKSDMLLSACRNGMLPATECLIELGADVNTGEGSNTPLFLAVASLHEDVVKFLLKQDIQDLRTPLVQSLKQESHTISGLILQQLGYDRDGGVICWSGLELDSLEEKWIVTALAIGLSSAQDTERGKTYIDKIKTSEQRRRKRKLGKLAYSKSDSYLKHPQVRLRHKIIFEDKPKEETRARPQDPVVHPTTSMVVVTNSNPFFEPPQQRFNRSVSTQDSGPDLSPRFPRITRLPTIVAGSPPEEPEIPVFDASQTDEEEWREFTLSGANVAYSSNDPRLQPSPTNPRKNSLEKGQWKRKHRTPLGSVSSDEGSSPRLGGRKMSEPVLSDLEHVKLPRRRSEEFSKDLAQEFKTLVYFDISENCVRNVTALVSPKLTDNFTKLHTLDLRCNRISQLPVDMWKNLPNLQTLDASENELETFPDTLLQCKKLEELRLGFNKIQIVTLTYFNTSLKKLYLTKNQLKELPDEIGRYLHNVHELHLSQNDLIALPDTSIGLQKLQTLDLSHNQIDCVPDECLLSCTKLETLDLSYNILTRLPDEKYAEKLSSLAKLKLRHNHLAEKEPFYIPRFILQLPSLRTIDISENQLTGFPSLSNWKTQTMKDFIASKNNITKLSLEDSKVWSKLEKLHVSHNKLKMLPKEIGQFTSLTSLDFSHNKDITSLPDELGRCSKIYEMPIDGLDLDISRTVTGRRVKDIISYLHNRLKKAQRYYRMKLMVVGYGGRGKTTLLKTLMKEKMKKKENRPTVGVVVKDWVYIMYDRRSNDDGIRLFSSGRRVQVTLNTWDFAGQEDFYSTHNCYLSNRAVYLVVFDLRKGVNECEILKSWLGSIRSRAPGCPVFIVGTHLDKLDEGNREKRITQVTDMLREINIKPGFPDITHVFLVDASCDNEDMEDLRKAIKTVVDQFQIRGKRVMGEKIPASYVQLADLLSERARSEECKYPVLQYRELSDLVHAKKLDLDDNELQQAVQFLHESGVLLHYDDASLRLKDYYFIDPGWLCQMMAQIITVRQINPFINTDGILKKRDVDILFKGSTKFPQYLIPQYIKLLEKFEIALPHSDTELLIPSKLPKAKPVIHPPGLIKISRIYRMPHVPIGLWFRLIARMISMTTHIGFQSITNLGKPQKTVCWRKGLYIYWSEFEYFLLDSSTDAVEQIDSIHITVPSSRQGSRLLGQIVDSLDNLIDEWYPGLTCIDPMMGQEVLEILAPCSQCKDSPYMFTIRELRTVASKQDFVHCPSHENDIHIGEVAPDLVLGDLEDELKLDSSEFILEESSDKQLGDGSFGDVYKATYKNKEVAAKLFKEVADVHALTMLRQEATIIRCLKHPSVVCMVAVGIRPPVILMELAPYGTLGHLSKREHKRALQHRIALQVAEGLMYLHNIMIIFRDMKPENVLIFSTSLDATINAKISDYGIARVTTLQGQMSQEGTPAFRAPEVIRKENYSFKADIYSYGLTMYVMMTKKHPLDYMDSRGEMDRAIAEGITIPQPDSDRVSPVIWPDMTTIIMSCLCYEPEERPHAEEVWEALRRPEVVSLKRHIPVSRSTTVECLCVEDDVYFAGKKDLRLWIASGDSETFQLSYKLVSDHSSETKGQLFKYGRILCMESLGDHRLALGTQVGKVWVFDTSKCNLLHASAQLKDSVLSLKHVKGDIEGGVLLAGLANGKVAIFPLQELLQDGDVDPICLYPGYEHEPVVCMTKLGRRIFHSCGTRIIVLNTTKGKGIAVDKEIETSDSRDPSCPPIYTLAVLKGHIIFSRKSSSIVEIWDASNQKIQNQFGVEEKFGIPKTEARVTALSVDSTSLWIGTHGGYIGVMDVKTLNVIALTHRHMRAVRSLVHVKDKGSSRNKIVFSGGLGFKDIGNFAAQKQDMCGCVLVWDSEFPQYSKAVADYERNRRALHSSDSEQIIYKRSGSQSSQGGDESVT
ncbi:leucine-rich repeat serine/threonine-protein kinase 2-like isoform X2 [Mercenaria mercenaria]|uniref:leucine-rich repeat serine/threonine-protein kinase 2-like isoform X2 n=1 Tax=Mercenaria mercenaria TaxID=6596 RepID=UPI00234EF3D0|nr:leucine-rich repeat serine/threonine-protein kinase 2-like isoform X2 [Mercenaria mercenaria]